MIKGAVKNLKEKTGSSKAAILKYILQNYKVGDNIKAVCCFRGIWVWQILFDAFYRFLRPVENFVA